MVKCPDCLKEVSQYKKKWKFGVYDVEAYSCDCETTFRSYKRNGIVRYNLKKRPGSRFRKY